jgi:hypothetical protein
MPTIPLVNVLYYLFTPLMLKINVDIRRLPPLWGNEPLEE